MQSVASKSAMWSQRQEEKEWCCHRFGFQEELSWNEAGHVDPRSEAGLYQVMSSHPDNHDDEGGGDDDDGDSNDDDRDNDSNSC